jgi:glycosyltransferase involved in cell wall biosynthesis
MSAIKLTIGMANWSDLQGAWWTLTAIRQYHVKRERSDVELLVVDDMPTKQEALEHICNNAGARYVHHSKNKGPAHAKDSVWEHARGSHVLLLDSHVLLAECSVDYIIDAIDSDLIGKDLWTGPLLSESGHCIATEMLPEWRGTMFGVWHIDHKLKEEKIKEIHGHGSAYTLMKKQHYPGFNKNFRGFGGEELSLHATVNRRGGKCYSHQALGWVHRFFRSEPVTYRLTLNDKYWNFLVGFYDLGWSTLQVREYFRRHLHVDQCEVIEKEVQQLFPDIFTRPDGKRFVAHD